MTHFLRTQRTSDDVLFEALKRLEEPAQVMDGDLLGGWKPWTS